MTREEKYKMLRNSGWEFSEDYPSAGITVMCKNISSTPDCPGWILCTLLKNGEIKQGRHAPSH